MHFSYEVKIPKNTLQAAPYEQILLLSAGIITGMQINIPAGHAGTAHLILLFQEFQLYPLSCGQDYHGDNTEIPWHDRFDMGTGPFFLKARGWNSDTVSDHRFLVFIEVLTSDQIGMNTGAVGLQDLQGLVGSTLEV